MVSTSSDSVEAAHPPASRRHYRVISSSLTSSSSRGIQRRLVKRDQYDISQREPLLRQAERPRGNRLPYSELSTTRVASASAANRTYGDASTRNQVEEEASVDIFELPDGSGRYPTDNYPPLTTSQGVDSSSIPLDPSSRRTTIFVGHSNPAQVEASHAEGVRHASTRHPSIECSSEMHHPVDRDDYLLARGANPRTGIVTPGSHSASSSVDGGELPRNYGSVPQSRWRQRGDQWISSDQDHQMPWPGHSKPMQPEPPYYKLRTPPRLSVGNRDSSGSHRVPSGPRELGNVATKVPFPGQTGTFEPSQPAVGVQLSASTANVAALSPHEEWPAVRRRPVGNPPAKGPTDHQSQGIEDIGGSSDTVLKKPRFNTDLRSSSAPDFPKLRNVTPYNLDKDLPVPPANASPALGVEQDKMGENPFLEHQVPATATDASSSKTSNTSGHPMTEKELPCLPMSSGPSPLRQESTPPSMNIQEVSEKTTSPPTLRNLMPQGPRGGDPAYPYVRKTRSGYPTPVKRPNAPTGERLMPIPVYDNPPKHPSSLTRTTVAATEGPRPMPGSATRPMNRHQDDFNPSSSTTIIPTDTFMNRPSVPRPLRIGPRPLVPEMRMMGHGRHGLVPRPTPPSSSDIIMNTGMLSNTDDMMSIPLPRIRPRAMTRPQMPMRAEGMYGIPRMGPNHNRANTTGIESPQTWRPGGIQPIQRLDPPEPETDLVPPPLKLRQPSHELNRPKELPLNSNPATGGLGLMRKCSRCHHGFVDVKARGMDSVTPTSGLQRADAEASEGFKKVHPTGSPLPGLPEDIDENDGFPLSISPSLPEADAVNERDHTICCPDCCKDEDCHEGCLGHPSPTSTPSPTKSIWSEAQSPSSGSEVDGWEHMGVGKRGDRGDSNGSPFGKNTMGQTPKKDHPNFHSDGSVSPIELSALPRTPASSSGESSSGQSSEALAAALSASGLPKLKVSKPGNHRRQGSSSSPLIGVGLTMPNSGDTHGARVAGGSRLRVPTPAGLAIVCSGGAKSRNVSGTSEATFEFQVPGFGTLGSGNAFGEMVLVPFEATKMWIQNHPHVTKMGWEVAERAWQMSQIMTTTGWRLWAVVFVYSKTGKLKLKMAKGETAGGFAVDCARSLVYLMVFLAVSVFVVRVLRIVVGVASIVGWLFKAVFWLLKQVLGVGLVR